MSGIELGSPFYIIYLMKNPIKIGQLFLTKTIMNVQTTFQTHIEYVYDALRVKCVYIIYTYVSINLNVYLQYSY